ncbi:MAG: nucleotidyltransferase family protein [Synergistaceae bacterium]|nr:nucleotidyltransferase family protein [Synergistaceae bacterium]
MKIYAIIREKANFRWFEIINAVIAELNPLHKGHERLFRFAKAQSSGLVVVLSSAFTQRGSPSLVDKFARSKMAVAAGADLVVELPFLFSCNAAPEFARGAVNLLGLTGLADCLVFGMEDPDYDVDSLVNVMSSEEYLASLRANLSAGTSFSKANALAMESFLPGSCEFISKPNNLLAVSYIMNINKRMKVLTMKREGAYRSKLIREDMTRNFDMMPDYSKKILLESTLADESRLWDLLQCIFIRSRPDELRRIYGIDEGIENLFLKNWRRAKGLDDFIGSCVCARYTRAHIRRRLVYIMLNLGRYETQGFMRSSVPYCRVLAFNSLGREILRECRGKSRVRIITSLSQAKSKHEKFFAQVEYRVSQLYALLFDNPDMSQESHKVLQFP